jgi:putative transposase
MGFSPCMARPSRNSAQERVLNPSRIFFATTNAWEGSCLLRSCVGERKFKLHDFVVMPNHLHALMTVDSDMTIEKAMQLIKGRFSFRIKKEYGYLGEVWQRGFSEDQVLNPASFEAHRRYIAENPVKAGMVSRPEDFPYCYESLKRRKLETKIGLGEKAKP